MTRDDVTIAGVHLRSIQMCPRSIIRDEGTAARTSKKVLLDQRLEEASALNGVDLPQAARLLKGQTQSWHFSELGANASSASDRVSTGAVFPIGNVGTRPAEFEFIVIPPVALTVVCGD